MQRVSVAGMPILSVSEGRIDASTLLGIAKHGERAQSSADRRRLHLSREWKKYADLVPNIDNKFIEPARAVQLLRVAGIGFNMPEGAEDMLVEFVGVGTPETLARGGPASGGRRGSQGSEAL